MRLFARVMFFAAGLLPIAEGTAVASHSCPTPQPSFAYVDADNDGCYTSGVDSDSVDADLQAPQPMANTPSFVAPADTGLVIPKQLVLPVDADPYWSVPNDVWIDGKLSGPSSLRIEAGGTTRVNGSIRIKAQGFSNEGDLRLGCFAGCGPTIVDDGAKITNNGQLRIYDAAVGNDARISVKCAPGGVPSCGGSAYFYRATSIGNGVRLASPGGIVFEDGALPLEIGDDCDFRTKSVMTDGGTLGFSLRMELPAGLNVGTGARMSAGGSLTIRGALDSDPSTGAITFGSGAALAGSGVVIGGTAIDIGADGDLRGKRDISLEGRLSSVIVSASTGPLLVGNDTSMYGGRIRLLGNIGDVAVGSGVTLTTASTAQELELSGATISVAAGSKIVKTTGDGIPIEIAAATSISIVSSSMTGAGIDVSLSQPAGLIDFTMDEMSGGLGTTAKFTAPGGTCDLSGSTFTKSTLDTTACGTVVGP